MPGAGGLIITALEGMWADIQKRHQEVPTVVLITGTSKQAGGNRWGHHWPDRWHQHGAQKMAPELFIAGELLSLGAARVLQTMLHEAAHALAYERGIKDTSRSGNRYHNGRFAELAEEMGLARPDVPSKSIGFSACTITEDTVKAYASTIEALEAAKVAHLVPVLEAAGGQATGNAGKRVAVQCGGCSPARKFQLTPRQLATGPICCGLCRQEFLPVAG